MSEEAQRLKTVGNEAFKNKLFHKSIKCYTESLLLEPNPIVFSNRAQAYINIRKWNESLMDSNKAIESKGDCSKAYYRRSYVYEKMGFTSLALSDIKKALTLSSDSSIVKLHELLLTKKEKTKTVTVQPCEMGDELRSDHLKELLIEMDQLSQETAQSNDELTKEDTFVKDVLKTPNSFSEFMAQYDYLIRCPKKIAEYFLLIPIHFYSVLFDDMLEIQIFSTVLTGFRELLNSKESFDLYRERITDCLQRLPDVERFDMVILCMSPEDRENLRLICGQLSSSHSQDIITKFDKT